MRRCAHESVWLTLPGYGGICEECGGPVLETPEGSYALDESKGPVYLLGCGADCPCQQPRPAADGSWWSLSGDRFRLAETPGGYTYELVA